MGYVVSIRPSFLCSNYRLDSPAVRGMGRKEKHLKVLAWSFASSTIADPWSYDFSAFEAKDDHIRCLSHFMFETRYLTFTVKITSSLSLIRFPNLLRKRDLDSRMAWVYQRQRQNLIGIFSVYLCDRMKLRRYSAVQNPIQHEYRLITFRIRLSKQASYKDADVS